MEDSYRYFENHACVYYPCHKGIEHMNCLFCFCPLYLRKDCPGNPRFFEKNGKEIKIIFQRHVMNCRKNIYQNMVDIVIIFLS